MARVRARVAHRGGGLGQRSGAAPSVIRRRCACAPFGKITADMPDHSTASSMAAAASPPLIDIGINLAHDSFDRDRDAVIARAHAAGVVQMVVTGATLAGSIRALALAHEH